MIKEQILKLIEEALSSLVKTGSLSAQALTVMGVITRTKNPEHGDFASNVAMVLAKGEQKAPQKIANLIKDELIGRHGDFFTKIEIAGPGFINLTLSPKALSQIVPHIIQKGASYGHWPKNNQRALVEF